MSKLSRNLAGLAVITVAVVAYRAYRKSRPLTEDYVNEFTRDLYGSPDQVIQMRLSLDRSSGRK